MAMDWYHYCKVCGDWYNPHYRIGVCETCNPDLAKDLPPRAELYAVARGPVNFAVESEDRSEPEQSEVADALEPEQPQKTWEPEPVDPMPPPAPIKPSVERSDNADDSDLYLTATQEFYGADRDEALWAKSLALSQGDSGSAKYKYIQLRVDQLSGSSKAPPSRVEATSSAAKINRAPPAGRPLSQEGDRELIQAIRDGRLRGQKHDGVWYLQEEAQSQSAKPGPVPQSGSAELPIDRIKGFLGKLSRGDYGLAKTYWLYLALYPGLLIFAFQLAAGAIFSVNVEDASADTLMEATFLSAVKVSAASAVFSLILLPYYIPAYMGVWRAASRYEGRKLWAVLAKVICVLAAMSLVGNIYGLHYFVTVL